MLKNKSGFTLVEIMVVLLILSVLFTALYMGVQPYMMRSRDTKRITSVLSYSNIIDTYEKNFDTFPSNYGSGWLPAVLWYCLTEIWQRTVNHATLPPMNKKDQMFAALNSETSSPPVDPNPERSPIAPCSMSWSYLYSKMEYWSNNEKEIAILAANLEIKDSANYGTGSDLINSAKIPEIILARKWTLTSSMSDQLYIITKLH